MYAEVYANCRQNEGIILDSKADMTTNKMPGGRINSGFRTKENPPNLAG